MKFQTKLKVVFTLFVLVFAVSTANAGQPVAEDLRLTIDKALEIAVDQNLSVKIADEEIARVDWLKRENWYMLLPSVGANAQYTNNVLKPVFFSDFFPGGKMEIGSTNSYAVTGTLQVPIFSLALLKNIEMSEIELRSALESARSTKIELIAQVKNSFYGILMLEESLKVLEESYKNAKETADNIRKMYENGLASEYDKIRSDVAVRNILPSITQAKNGLELSKMQLKVLLSLDLNTPVVLEGSISQYENEISGYNPAEDLTLDGNSNLRTMDIQMEKLDKSIELIRSQRLPSVAGFANYQLQMQNQEFSFRDRWSNSFAVGLAIQIPIFSKMSNVLKEKQSRVVMRQLQLQKELLESNLSLAARNSLNEMSRTKIQLESDKEAVMQAKKGYEISKVRYSTGAGTLLELNDTEVALTRSKLNLNQTIYDYIKAKNDYEKVLGNDSIEKTENNRQ
ncbi:MAG: TolC family protein [Bacteroidetes bacterium HGW-Bacteroidetes-8]|jgi:outer membrane protein TolC|nr:MAG: TolC family protein [Bacteroidetes bacterium HGW-Bacteroidetes-8]